MEKELLRRLEVLQKSCEEMLFYKKKYNHRDAQYIMYYEFILQDLNSIRNIVTDKLIEIIKKYNRGEVI